MEYRRLRGDDAATFLALATDEHVRRYLLDGQIVGADWVDAEIVRSDGLFDEFGVGLWLVVEDGDPIGFAGYRRFEEIGPEPQLMYAFLERVTGRGRATRTARWLLEQVDWDRVVSAVDEPNRASSRVLEKVGFRGCGSVPGAFGRIRIYEWLRASRPG